MRAINSTVMKQSNRKMVLDYIRKNSISRAELSDCTLLTRASITQIIDELMEEGLVTETSIVGRNRLGRRLTQLALVKDSRYFIGVNLSRLQYDLGVIDLSGEVLYQATGAIANRPVNDVLSEICDMIPESVERLEIDWSKIGGIGICAPGPLNSATGTILNPPNFSLWHNTPIAEIVHARTGLNVTLENVSNAHALDEKYFGVGLQGAEDFMLLRVDEGVGAGFILKNRLFTGPKGQSPEIGHISVNREGPECPCGNRGCLERYISFPEILEGTTFHSWRQVMDGLICNPEAEAVVERAVSWLSVAIINILNIFDLEKIVLSGNFVYHGEILAERLNQSIRGRSLRQAENNPVVSGGKIEIARIAAMPAYQELFLA